MALRMAVLLSGNGSTLQNILDQCAAGNIDGEVVCVLSSREGVYGLERAREAGITAVCVPRNEYPDAESFGEAVWDTVRPFTPELIVLAGFMSLLPIHPDYRGRIMNVHPALIPAFSGQGMYGSHVHQAAIEYGVKLSGVTVHFVNEDYDRGPVILQSAVRVEEDDTPDTLAERVQAEERRVYPVAIQLFAEDRLRIEGRRVRILPPRDES